MKNNPKTSTYRLCVLLSLLALCSCEPDTAVDVALGGKVPPTFSFSGPWWARDFQILEVPPKSVNKNGQNTEQVKKIWLVTLGNDNGRRAKDWPRITYGSIPEGFIQQIPNVGTSPPQLIEGKIYVAQALDNALNGGACYFVIRNGKSVTVSPSEVLQEQR